MADEVKETPWSRSIGRGLGRATGSLASWAEDDYLPVHKIYHSPGGFLAEAIRRAWHMAQPHVTEAASEIGTGFSEGLGTPRAEAGLSTQELPRSPELQSAMEQFHDESTGEAQMLEAAKKRFHDEVTGEDRRRSPELQAAMEQFHGESTGEDYVPDPNLEKPEEKKPEQDSVLATIGKGIGNIAKGAVENRAFARAAEIADGRLKESEQIREAKQAGDRADRQLDILATKYDSERHNMQQKKAEDTRKALAKLGEKQQKELRKLYGDLVGDATSSKFFKALKLYESFLVQHGVPNADIQVAAVLAKKQGRVANTLRGHSGVDTIREALERSKSLLSEDPSSETGPQVTDATNEIKRILMQDAGLSPEYVEDILFRGGRTVQDALAHLEASVGTVDKLINREVQAYAGAGQSTKAPDVYGSSLRNMYFEPADQAMSAIERLRQGL